MRNEKHFIQQGIWEGLGQCQHPLLAWCHRLPCQPLVCNRSRRIGSSPNEFHHLLIERGEKFWMLKVNQKRFSRNLTWGYERISALNDQDLDGISILISTIFVSTFFRTNLTVRKFVTVAKKKINGMSFNTLNHYIGNGWVKCKVFHGFVDETVYRCINFFNSIHRWMIINMICFEIIHI